MTSTEAATLRIVPANEVSWDDLRAVVGAARCHDDPCFCQRFKILTSQWRSVWAAGTLSPPPGSGK